MKRPVRKKRPNGFTLIEVMIATAIFALIMATLATGMRLTQRSWIRGENQARIDADLRLTHRMFTQSVGRAATALRIRRPRSSPGFGFAGSSSQLDLLVRRPSRSAVGGLYQLQYLIEPTDSGTALRLFITPFRPDTIGGASEERGRAITLLETPGKMSFSYLSRPTNRSDAATWLAEWPASIETPALVRLRIDRIEKRGPPTPIDIVARLSQTLGANCLDSSAIARGRTRVRNQCL